MNKNKENISERVIAVNENLRETKRENVLYEKITREDGSQFLKRVKSNATLLGQRIEIALRNLTPINTGDDFTNVASTTKIRTVDADTKFIEGTLTGGTVPANRGTYIFGIMLGTDGGDDNLVSDIVEHAKGFDLEKVAPWKFVELGAETANTSTTGNEGFYFDEYCLRTEMTHDGSTYGAYLAKRLDFDIEVTDQNGTIVNDYPDLIVNDTSVVSVTGTTSFNVEEEDLLEYFNIKIGSLNGRMYSSMMFLAGTKFEVQLNGKTYTDYRNVRVAHKLNFKSLKLAKADRREYIYTQKY